MDASNQKVSAAVDEYGHETILYYEKICGHCFLSPGGKEITRELVSMVDLKPGDKVLDIGGGIGGSAFYMAKNFNVKVTSVDVSAYNTKIGQERGKEMGCGSEHVLFETADIRFKEYPPESFDVVFAITCFFYIEDKVTLLKKLYKFLKPGGKLVFGDLCCRLGEHSQNLQHFAQKWNAHIVSLEAYEQMMNGQANFANVRVTDKSSRIKEVLQSCVARIGEAKEEFCKEFGEKTHTQVFTLLREDADLFDKGDLRAGLFCAEKLP